MGERAGGEIFVEKGFLIGRMREGVDRVRFYFTGSISNISYKA